MYSVFYEGYVKNGLMAGITGSYTFDGNQFGYCTMRQYSGSVDASFSEDRFTANYSSTINGTSTRLSTTVQNPIAGLNVYKSGDATGVTSGWITSTSAKVYTSDNVSLSDLIETNLYSYKGDSGGIVYCDVYGGQASISGIIEGGVPGKTYVVKASHINNAFNCIPY